MSIGHVHNTVGTNVNSVTQHPPGILALIPKEMVFVAPVRFGEHTMPKGCHCHREMPGMLTKQYWPAYKKNRGFVDE